MTYQISRAEDADAKEWDSFAVGTEDWTHFHRFGWRRVIARSLKHQSLYLMARDDAGLLRGVLPLVRVKSALFGDFIVSMPFLNYGGPLGEENARTALFDAAVKLASEKKADLLELRCRAPGTTAMQVSTRKITVLLDVQGRPAADVWSALDSKVRSQVRRPRKAGIVVQFGPDRLHDFYRVFCHHMRDLGTPVLPLSFFKAALDEFAGEMWIGVAYLEGKPVACGCGFQWGREFEMTWASSLRQHSALSPNMLLYWSFIERAAEAQLNVFNFGRCTPNGNTHKFKRQWGTRDEQLWWYSHSKSGVRTTPSVDGGYSWGPRLWRHLPLRLATALGPYIVRNIP